MFLVPLTGNILVQNRKPVQIVHVSSFIYLIWLDKVETCDGIFHDETETMNTTVTLTLSQLHV